MKWFLSVAIVAVLALSANAFELEEEGDPRVGFFSVGTNGATTLTFNATSIQNAVIVALFIIVLGALIIPLFGQPDEGYESSSGYGYGYEQPSYGSSAYETPSYHGYAKRSLELMAPVVAALSKGQEKYEN
jgi:hypothetical protein